MKWPWVRAVDVALAVGAPARPRRHAARCSPGGRAWWCSVPPPPPRPPRSRPRRRRCRIRSAWRCWTAWSAPARYALGEQVVVQHRRVRRHRRLDVDDVRQHLVVDLDQVERFLGDRRAWWRRPRPPRGRRTAPCRAPCTLLGQVPVVDRCRRPAMRFLGGDVGEVGGRDHRHHARQRLRLRGVDAA